MDYSEAGTTGIYNDTVSTGGGGSSFSDFHSSFPGSGRYDDDDLSHTNDDDGYALSIEIAGASSDKDKVLFSVQTKTTLPDFKQPECSVKRLHEEFEWLHNYLVDNEAYAGLIVPPAPPKPDFDTSRAMLQHISEFENQMTKEEAQRTKANLEVEYLASFKKTVATHDIFLQRLASHPVFRRDYGFRIFLEYPEEMSVRTKTRKEKTANFLQSISKTAEETLGGLGNANNPLHQGDDDHFFTEEKVSLMAFHKAIKEATSSSDQATKHRRAVAEAAGRVEIALDTLVPKERLCTPEADLVSVLGTFFQGYNKVQLRLTSDESIKLCDTMRYYSAETEAARDLLYRRSRALADLENSSKSLEKARLKDRMVAQAEDQHTDAHNKFKRISDSGRRELEDFKIRRIKYFQKNLTDLADVEIRYAKQHIDLIKSTLDRINQLQVPSSAAPSSSPSE